MQMGGVVWRGRMKSVVERFIENFKNSSASQEIMTFLINSPIKSYCYNIIYYIILYYIIL